MFYCNRTAAVAADQMMMITLSQFIHEPAVAHVRGKGKSICGQEFQCAIDGWLGEAREFLAAQVIDLGRREMSVRMAQDV